MSNLASLKNFDVVIIGGGVIGTAILHSLSQLQLSIALLEKEAEISFGTTKANSGIVHAGFHSKPGTLKAKTCVEGARMYPKLCENLKVPFKQNGVLMVAFDKKQLTDLEFYQEQGRQNGLFDLQILSQDELKKLEPNLSKNIVAGLFAPNGGIVSPFELAIAQGENAKNNGAEIFCSSEVLSMEEKGSHILITTNRGKFLTKIVINCAGLHADSIARLLGDYSFTIKPRKGEEYLLDKRVGDLVNSTIFPLPTPTSKGILIIPTVHGNLMLGPTAEELDQRDDFSTTSLGFEQIYSFCTKMVNGLEKKDLIASFAGIRAASDRGDFIIEFSPTVSQLINVAGIESPGLTAAPYIGEMVKEMVRDKLASTGQKVEKKPDFNAVLPKKLRFSELSTEELKEAIAKDKRFAHIICRCEMVSEAEIVEAINNGARTLDGIKLRTRAGMGRCQGGFCTPKIIKILSRELNMPPSEITKRGNESFLVPYLAKELIERKEQ